MSWRATVGTDGPHRRRLAAIVASTLLTTGLTAASGLVAPSALADTAPPAGQPATVSADALPTVQIDGVVWAQVMVGNTVYVAGKFTSARPAGSPAGTNETPRGGLLAYDITTGALNTSFNHTLNGQGKTIAKSPDGSRIYVGGDFTTVDGQKHYRVAAFDTATGALVNSFAPTLDATVAAITVTSSAVYLGGVFSSVNGQARARLAAVTPAGALLTWNPGADAPITALAMAPDNSRVVVAGRFAALGGQTRYGLGTVDVSTGAALSWPSNFIVKDYGANSALLSLSSDGTSMYATGYSYYAGNQGNFEGRFGFNPYTGAITMLDDCHGDTYSSWPMNGVLYVASHSHSCDTIGSFPDTDPRQHHFALADTTAATGTVRRNVYGGYYNFQGQPAPTQLAWYPTVAPGTFTGQSQAGWSVTGNGTYLSFGGEFPTVNGTAQQGLVRFAVRAVAPNKQGPRSNAATTPAAAAAGAGRATVSWQTTWDYDNGALTYRLYRDGGAAPIDTRTVESRFWAPSTQTFTDGGLAAGSHTYKVTVTDPLGNVYTSGVSSPVTVTGTTNQPPTAAFTVSCTALNCSVDGSASRDPDGSIAAYSWDFGDGGTAAGATASHTYASAGTYTVTVTVTDNAGARAASSRSVTVAPANNGGQVFAADAFNRTVTGGWGTADTGGSWSALGTSSALSVVPGAGRITSAAAGAGAGVSLSTPSASSDLTMTLTLDKIASGGGIYVSLIGRRVANNSEYRSVVKIGADGSVSLSFSKLAGSSTEVVIGSKVVVPGLTYTAGTPLSVRLVTSGSGTTTMSVKAWTGGTEPAAFQNSTTDTTAGLQSAGGVGVRTYLSGSAANAPVTVSVGALRAASVA